MYNWITIMLLYLSFIFVLGLAIGSFINVCIYRIPRDESVVKPRSRCPGCSSLIQWYDNIPLVSYLLLKGKCRRCGKPISLQYPLIELLTAVLFSAVGWKFAFQPVLPLYLFYTFVLIVISGIDYQCQIIPDIFSYSLLGAGLLFSCINIPLGAAMGARILNAALGGLLGGGILFIIGYAAEKAIGQEAMGGGDVKLLAGVGAFLGWQKVFSTLFIGSLVASVLGLSLMALHRLKRREYIPFGPFLAFASYINLFLPDPWQLLLSMTFPL